jgi:predicted nucleic acid-binding protein
MIVVADSSALIALAVCDALPLLASVADEIVIPPAVFDEVVVEGRPHSEALRTFLEGRVESVDAGELES